MNRDANKDQTERMVLTCSQFSAGSATRQGFIMRIIVDAAMYQIWHNLSCMTYSYVRDMGKVMERSTSQHAVMPLRAS